MDVCFLKTAFLLYNRCFPKCSASSMLVFKVDASRAARSNASRATANCSPGNSYKQVLYDFNIFGIQDITGKKAS